VTSETIHWDSYSDDIYYFIKGTRIMRHTLSTNTTTVIADYSTDGHGFTSIYQGGTGDMSKDNWMAFAAVTEHQVCSINLNTSQTYCADYTAPNPGNLVGYSFIDFVNMAHGVDSVTGKRYVLLMSSPAIAVFSVNASTGKLDFEFRGPERPPEFQDASGNNNDLCEPGESCMPPWHSAVAEDAAG